MMDGMWVPVNGPDTLEPSPETTSKDCEEG